MAVIEQTPISNFTGNGVTTVFAFDFLVPLNTDLLVIVDGVTQALGTDYTVAGTGVSSGGTVTFTTAPASGVAVSVVRAIPATRSTDYQENGDLLADVLNDDFDRIVLMVQDATAVVGVRAVRGPVGESLVDLPPAASRANTTLGFDSDGQPTVLTPDTGTAADVLTRLADVTDTTKGAVLVGYDALLSYGTGKNVAAALSGAGRILQGADPTGATDNTALLKALFDVTIPADTIAVLPAGTYKVSGPITSSSYAAGSLHIRCVGDVTIQVDASSTAFSKLISCYTTAINSSTITGGRLTLELANLCANGIYLRHSGTDGGTVNWGPVTVNNAKNNTAVAEENQALLVYGRYTSVKLDHPIVDGVDRVQNPDGGCKGISISEVVGQVTITSPDVARVMAGPGASQDADGIAVFGYDTAGNPALYAKRRGSLQITNPVITDCQGRSIKTQISESLIVNPRIYRQGVVAFATADIDHQIGGVHTITDPTFNWRKDGATSPVPIGFYPISLQARCSDSENRFTVRGGTIQSAVSVVRAVFVTIGATALDNSVSVEGMEAIAVDGLATALYSSGFVEFYGNQAESAVGNTHFRLHGNRMAQGGGALLAMSGNTIANASKLSVDLVGNVNTGADDSANKVLAQLSGTVVTQMRSLLTRDNTGFTDYRGTWVFDTQTLPVGTKFTYDRASSTVTNGPVIAAGTYVDVECLGAMTATTRKVRMTVDAAGTMNEHYTQTGAWGVIK